MVMNYTFKHKNSGFQII